MQMYVPGTDLRKIVVEKVVTSDNIVASWERIADNIPTNYEKYSFELLKSVTDLWITIRGYAFAKGFTQKFERR